MQLLVMSFSTPDGLTTGWTPLITMSRFILPSICWCYSSSFLLFLCPQKQSFKISLNLRLLWQVLLTHIIWPDSILFQFVLHDLIKEEGGEFTPSICSFSVVFNGCHWHPSSMSRFPGTTHLSSRYLLLKLLPGKQGLNSLIKQILDCPYFLMSTRIQEISPMVK